MKVRLKINGILISVTVLLVVFFPRVFIRVNSWGWPAEILKIFGISLILLGQVLRVSARGYKAQHSREGSLLIVGGPYLLVRNPMYLGIFLIGSGITLVLFKLWVAAVLMIIFVLRYLPLTFEEEKKLRKIFPQEYRQYESRVHRMLPSWQVLLSKNIGEYLPIQLPWIKKEIGSIFAVLFIVFFLRSSSSLNTGLRVYLHEAAAIIGVLLLFIVLVIYLIRRTKYLYKNDSDRNKNN
ncbi:MAG: isoprenylcysteine carboxylmethyltransferase family protein [Candidatus Omnitrophota bacterium]